jgi:hypothetical protein
MITELSTAERLRIEVADFLDSLAEYLDNHSDADQPTGSPFPIPNEAMRLYRQLDELRPTLMRYAEAKAAGSLLVDAGLKASILLHAIRGIVANRSADATIRMTAIAALNAIGEKL